MSRGPFLGCLGVVCGWRVLGCKENLKIKELVRIFKISLREFLFCSLPVATGEFLGASSWPEAAGRIQRKYSVIDFLPGKLRGASQMA